MPGRASYMALISVTRLRLRSARFLLAFVWYAIGSALQARGSSGNLGLCLRKTQGLTFWTLTAWQNVGTMGAFRAGFPHRKAMTKLIYWCDEAAFAHWEQDSRQLPSWDYASEQLRKVGHLSKVMYPSQNQRKGRIVTT